MLVDDGVAVTDTCDFEFTLWDEAAAGNQVGSTIAQTIDVEDGLFTAPLDFAVVAFTGEARWLEISVCCPSPCSPALTLLDPRQELTPAPHALALPGLYTIDDVESPNILAGSRANVITSGVLGATIGGGGSPGEFVGPNVVTDKFGTVSGGEHNRAGDNAGTTTDASFATVGGGFANGAIATFATVTGGSNNGAFAYAATSGGGYNCDAIGEYATTPGGENNRAGGDHSFAAGRYAEVRDAATVGDADGDEGTFVWADSTHGSGNKFVSTGPNQFLISAAGGVGIGTNAPDSALHVVESTAGGNGIRIEGTVDDANPNIVLREDGGASVNFRINEASGDRLEVQMNSTNRMVLTQTGNVGIGTNSPDTGFTLDVIGPSSAVRGFGNGAGSWGVYGLNANPSGTGVIGVALQSSGTSYGVRGVSNSSSGFDFYASGAGTDYGSSSSIRWKHNIKLIENPLEKVDQMRGVYFDWDAAHGAEHDVGMIAEEVGKILPEIVAYEENGTDAIGMDYARMTPLLVEAVKALHAKVQRLEAEKGGVTTTASTTVGARAAERLAEQQQLIATHQEQIETLQGRIERLERSMVAFRGKEAK